MEFVVVERSFDEPFDADVKTIAKEGAWCLEMYNLRHLGAYLSPDKRRMICVYEAPDAESVRIANRKLGLPFDRAWTATRHEAPK